MRAEEKCGRCAQEWLDLAVREGSELLAGVGFAKASRFDAKDLELVKGLEPENAGARLFAKFAK